QQKSSAAEGIQAHPESKKESGPDNQIHHAADDEESTNKVVSEDNSERSVDLECDTRLNKSGLNQSQDMNDSVLLVLSSDESQQSESNESEEDTVCFLKNSGQKESLNGNSENTSQDNAFFVIDTDITEGSTEIMAEKAANAAGKKFQKKKKFCN
ncbi:Deoxynucleotidyltransferase terminal-interacting protein 2, partial [Heterocephalus glaber]